MTVGPADARAAAIRASMASARPPRADGPGPDVDALRSAYLGLLKLCLCDLAATSTVSVGPTPEGTVEAQELRGEQLRVRAAGLDWPFQGMSMGGLRRLDDLQRCVTSVVRDGVEGDLIEAGAWRGGASIMMRATLDALGDTGDRTVWVADSFQGFPPADGSERDDLNAYLSAFDFLAVSEEEVRENFARFGFEHGVRFVPGFFKDTLPDLAEQRWAIVRLDADSYDATRVALESLYPGLADGGYLIVDDYGAADECREAVEEFRREHGLSEPLRHVDWTCVRWRRGDRGSSEDIEGNDRVSDADAVAQPETAVRRSLSVPSVREIELANELAELRTRLMHAEEEMGRLRASQGELRAAVNGYEESRSWRITRPLRAATRLARSLRLRRSR